MFGKLSGPKITNSSSYTKARNKAAEYAKNPVKMIRLVEEAAGKAESGRGPTAEVTAFLFTALRMVKAYAKQEYTNIPWQRLILIVTSIIYFVMPADVIPDFILGLGLLDDAALLGWTLKAVKSSVDDFRQWESERADLAAAEQNSK